MDKLLYVGTDVSRVSEGGELVNKRNISFLKRICGAQFYQYSPKRINSLLTFINALSGYLSFLSVWQARSVLSLIRREAISKVFLSSSKMGKLGKLIKEKYPNVEVDIFFHNIEKQYMEEECRVNNTFKNRFYKWAVAKNEKHSVDFGDRFIVLNARDACLLETYYAKKANMMLPISFFDSFSERKKADALLAKSNLFTMLFVGSNFFANVEGISWFIRNVLPLIDNSRLIIVGRDMDSAFMNSERVEVHGFVDDLSFYYYIADLVVLPIFSGGGMKTKTAEAMMYGCPILGTREAFEGYGVDYSKIGGCADSVDTMLEMIIDIRNNPLRRSEASVYSRSLFLRCYSDEVVIKAMHQLFANKSLKVE